MQRSISLSSRNSGFMKRMLQSSEELGPVMLADLGGVNRAPVIALGVLVAMGILSSVTIPRFHEYRVRTYDSEARTEIERACERAQAFLRANPGRVVILDELKRSGFEVSRGIEIMIEDGTNENLSLVARHESGSKVYDADHLCIIQEIPR
jgi:hypothetical protein